MATPNLSSRRNSPVGYHSVDIPGRVSPVSPVLPHQSRSLPVVPRLIRTESTSSQHAEIKEVKPAGLESSRLASSWSPSPGRSPSPVRRTFTASPGPLNLTPFPSPMPSPLPVSPSLSPNLSRSSKSPMLLQSKTNSSFFAHSFTSGSTMSLAAISNSSAYTPLGALQPELYKRETTIVIGSLDDPGSAENEAGDEKRKNVKCAKDSASVIGRLHFRLSYDFDKSDLIVHIIEVSDLQNCCDSDGSTSNCSGSISGPRFSKDAHIRLSLIPEVDQRRRQTSLRSFFDESFKFPVSHDDLPEKNLLFQVCEYDRFARSCVIGELLLELANHDITSAVEIWADISRNNRPDEEQPQVLVSLNYLPSAERLTVVVLKAKNLVVPPNRESVDPLVKLYLSINGKRVKKKKTEVRKATCHPVWNQAMTFTIPASKLNSCTLEVLVIDHGSDRSGKTSQLGVVYLGPEQTHAERQHWQDMAHNVRKSIAMWHFLH